MIDTNAVTNNLFIAYPIYSAAILPALAMRANFAVSPRMNSPKACGDVAEPIAQLRVPRSPVKIGIPSFEPEGAGERNLRQVECAAHQRMVDLRLPEVSHSSAAVCFVLEDCGRTLVLRPQDLAAPNCESVHHASRQGFETARLPRLVTGWQIKGRVAVEVIEVGADDSGFFNPTPSSRMR
jgi:hypothetical protein